MRDATLLVRLLLAAVFAAAAVGKLTDLRGWRHALAGFAVPDVALGTVSWLVPLAELATAAALLGSATAEPGAVASLALLLVFALAILVNLRQGRQAPCHCFGPLSAPTPVGRRTLVRAAALTALAAWLVARVAIDPGPAPVTWVSWLSTDRGIEIALAVALLLTVLAGAAVLGQVLAQNGRLLVRVEALEAANTSRAAPPAVGAAAAPFALDDLDGRPVTLDALCAAGRPVLLVFSDPDCGPCRALRGELATWQDRHGGELTLVIVSRGAREPNRFDRAVKPAPLVVLQRDREVAHAYNVHATPSGVLITPDGTIAAAPAVGSVAIAGLVARATCHEPLDDDERATTDGRATGPSVDAAPRALSIDRWPGRQAPRDHGLHAGLARGD